MLDRDDEGAETLKAFVEFAEERAKDEDRKKAMDRAHKTLLEVTDMLKEYGVTFMLSGGFYVSDETRIIILAGMTSRTAPTIHGIHREAYILAEQRMMEQLDRDHEVMEGSDD